MKKLVLILLFLLLISGCNQSNKQEETKYQRYFDMIALINDNDVFLEESNNFDISGEIAKVDGGYRFYIFVENPRIAMYDVEILAIEKNKDYSKNMAANLGVFEDSEYAFIPNQTNPNKGYYKGASISALTDKTSTKVYALIQWHNKDLSKLYREYITLDLSYEG